MFVNLVTGSESTASAIKNQLLRVFDFKIDIDVFILESGGKMLDTNKVTVFSSYAAYAEFCEIYGEGLFENFIISNRDIDILSLDKILTLPINKKIWVVNDSIESAEEALENIKKLGFDYLKLESYYPGCSVDINDMEIAITTGEIDKVPQGVKKIYDLGCRVMDFGSIYKVMKVLNCCDNFIEGFFKSNSEIIIKIAARVTNMARENNMLSNILKEKSQMRGHEARYEIKQILGESHLIKNTKTLAKKLAKTELTILIEGESGTGKELFANAIHNESSRRKFPFLAVNFSSLPDSLIESELFGYEEGAFTGAKKGGKQGLFELANGGTIFLDEIGDVSLKMQTRLLRVIQEKEVMRIGSNKIIPIDVRVVAATNKKLKNLIESKEFREDLYYRLKVGHIVIPPLRQRPEDIQEIVLSEMKKHAGIRISDEALFLLKSMKWYGNVRELKNTLECVIALTEEGYIDLKDIRAQDVSFEQIGNIDISEDMKLFISIVAELNSQGKLASRQSIKANFKIEGKKLTEYQARQLIAKATSESLIKKDEGSYGIKLTKKGKDVAKNQNR